MENNATAKSKKNSFCAFFRNAWLALKSGNRLRRSNKVAPLQPVSDTDSADPQPGPSSLEPTVPLDKTLSLSQASLFSDKPISCDANPADPGPGEEKQTKIKRKKKGIGVFLRRTCRAVRRTIQQKKRNKVAPLCPLPDTDSADPQLDPAIHEMTPLQDPTDPQPDSSVLEIMALQNPTDLQPDPVTEPTALQDPIDLQLDPSVHEPTALQDPTDPQPELSVLEIMALQNSTDLQPDPVTEPAALQDPIDLQLDPSVHEPRALQDPTDPQSESSVLEIMALQNPTDLQPDPVTEPTALEDPVDLQLDPSVHEPRALQDPTDPQSESSVLEIMALQNPTDLQPDPVTEPTALEDPIDLQLDPSVHEPTALQDPTDPLPGPSGSEPRSPKFRFRVKTCPGPSTLPFSEFYEVGEELGEGGFGTVYEGISKFSHEQVAIKFIPKSGADRFIAIPGCSKPLFAEVALNLLLNERPISPYIVHMLDWFEEEDQYILILEYPQPCKDLLKYVVSNGLRMHESQARDLMYQAVLGAKHCFDRGVFHRDIKLNNFLINTTTNHVKMIDFGCGDIIKSSYLGDFEGGYKPPEYYNMGLKYEAEPTTVWTLGVMMYRVMCKSQPFESLADMKYGILSFNSKISRECEDLIRRCLTREPTERATIEEILQHKWFQQGKKSK